MDNISRLGGPRRAPQLTPDGSKMLMEFGFPSSTLYVALSDGSDFRAISEDTGNFKFYSRPDLSSDGSRVVYATTKHEIERKDYLADSSLIRNFDLETSNLDGSETVRLTSNGAHDVFPSWSPNNRDIAFVRKWSDYRSERGVFVIRNAHRGGIRQVLDFERIEDLEFQEGGPYEYPSVDHISGPEWSPDGTLLAIGIRVYTLGGRWYSLYVVNADGSRLTQLYSTQDQDDELNWHNISGTPAWSPDGSSVAFLVHKISTTMNEEPDVRVIYSVEPDGSNLRELMMQESLALRHNQSDADLSWSPDGSEILFVGNQRDRRNSTGFTPTVQVLTVRMSEPRTVGVGTKASWSADGSRIAIVNELSIRDRSKPYLTTVALDGSDRKVVLVWHPDKDKSSSFEAGLQAANPPEKTCFLFICW